MAGGVFFNKGPLDLLIDFNRQTDGNGQRPGPFLDYLHRIKNHPLPFLKIQPLQMRGRIRR